MRSTALRLLSGTALWLLTMLTLGGTGFCAPAVTPIEVLQGEILELRLSGIGLSRVEGSLGKNKVAFYPDGGSEYKALVGIDLESKAGLTNIILESMTSAGTRRHVEIPLKIKVKSFPQESFVVPAQFDELGPDVLERIRREQAEFDNVFAVSKPERRWDLPFILPVSADISSPFGYRRVINGIPRAPHTGVDLRAPIGTEVFAANHGQVVLMGEFFYSGKTVVLDHGCGLYTMYFHLSEFKVEKGAEVQKGEIVGLSGMTGRVTGPHLHWGARLNGARVDPFQLIENFSASGQRTAGADVMIK